MTPASFHLEGEQPTAKVKASCTKNRKEAVHPLPLDAAKAPRGYLRTKPADEPLWPGNWVRRAAKMIRRDLQAARSAWLADALNTRQRQDREQSDFLAYRNADGLVGDFHALRHSFITMVGKAGVSAREHQDLARHSTYALTARYSHSRMYDLAAAFQALPIPTSPDREAVTLAATGTDGQPEILSPNLSPKTDCLRDSVRLRETIDVPTSPTTSPGNKPFQAFSSVK